MSELPVDKLAKSADLEEVMEIESPEVEGPKYRLLSNNHQQPITISQEAIRQSKTWSTLVKRWGPHDPDTTIPIQIDTDFATLQRIVKWCEHHKNDEELTEEEKDATDLQLPNWDKEHLTMNPSELYDFIWAVTPLEIELLLMYSCKIVANMVKGKTSDEMVVIFGIEKDSETDEEMMRRKKDMDEFMEKKRAREAAARELEKIGETGKDDEGMEDEGTEEEEEGESSI